MKPLLFLPVLALAAFGVQAQDLEAGPPPGTQDPLTETELNASEVPADTLEDDAENELGQVEEEPAGDLVRDFNEADKDGDGRLSVVEARDAFPSHVLVIDTDNDGQLSMLEVQNAIPGLHFEAGGETAADHPVGQEEYDAIVQTLEGDDEEQEA